MSRRARAIASFLPLLLLGAAPVQKGAIEGKVEPVGLKGVVVVARPGGKVSRGPLVAVANAADATTDENGRYRIEVEAGSYQVVAHAPGFVFAGDDPPEAKVTVKAGETVRGPDFNMVPAAEIQGTVTGLEGSPAVVAAMRRSPLPREQRFHNSARVAMDNGEYRIKDLRPGVYDLVLVSSTWGIIDCRGHLLGERDTLDSRDRRAIEEVNAAYAKAWSKSKPSEALAVISASYSDSQRNTYDTIKQQYAGAEKRKEMGWQVTRFSCKILLIQGSQSEAMAVIHQEEQQKVGRSRRPPAVSDLLVQYTKEGAAWKISGIEFIRDYLGLESRISRLTGVRCDLPEKYMAKYVGDPALGSILIKPGEVSPRHDFYLRSLLK